MLSSKPRKIAQAGDLDQEFSCSVCLDLLKDPVTIPCGHSYCTDCIKGCWDQEDKVGFYSCPQCRQTFTPRPVLNVNTMMAKVVKKSKKKNVNPAGHCYAEPGDVVCDVCTGRKRKAVKSCLVCLSSYCETDLKLHDKLNRGKRHKMTDATGELQEKICPHHDKLLEIYCRTDQQCICYLCTMDEHKRHDTVSITSGRTEKQEQLAKTKKRFQQRIQEREEEVQELKEAVDSVTRSAQAAVDHTDRIFTEMIRSIEERRSELKEVIRAQEKTAVSQAQGLLEKLEQEIAELRRRDAELEQLSLVEDHIYFLQSFQSLSAPIGSEVLPTITADPQCSFEEVTQSVSKLKEQLEEICNNELAAISAEVRSLSAVLPLKPDTREDFLKYAWKVTMDPNTANTEVYLSDGNKRASTGSSHSYPEHPERFDFWSQVLCREGLCRCFYWEVQWSGNQGVYIAVAYKGVNRKGNGNNSFFGGNKNSWSLFCSPSSYSFYHNNEETAVSGPHSSTIGVYLDHRAGTLSFYSISDTMNLLHRVHTTFTEPLYPGFSLQSRRGNNCGSYSTVQRRNMESDLGYSENRKINNWRSSFKILTPKESTLKSSTKKN